MLQELVTSNLAKILSNPEVADSIAARLTCDELDAVLEFLIVNWDDERDVLTMLRAHAFGDDDGDLHWFGGAPDGDPHGDEFERSEFALRSVQYADALAEWLGQRSAEAFKKTVEAIG